MYILLYSALVYISATINPTLAKWRPHAYKSELENRYNVSVGEGISSLAQQQNKHALTCFIQPNIIHTNHTDRPTHLTRAHGAHNVLHRSISLTFSTYACGGLKQIDFDLSLKLFTGLYHAGSATRSYIDEQFYLDVPKRYYSYLGNAMIVSNTYMEPNS